MRLLYSLCLYLLTPLALLRLVWLGRHNPAYRQRWSERFGFIDPGAMGAAPLWLHAVSVGEVRAAEPLVRKLHAQFPGLPIWITTTTPTGAATVERLFGAQVGHSYVPYDLPGSLARFLGRLQPRLVVIMETELWPNLLAACSRGRIPVLLANVRLSARSATGYRRIARLTRDMLGQVSVMAVQTPEDAMRLRELGAPAAGMQVTGSMKFDIRLPPGIHEQGEALRRVLGSNRPVWIAASTHAGEETQVLEAHARLRRSLPQALLVLVPRHPERCDQVAALCRERDFVTVRRSDDLPCDQSCAVYLVDTMGELPICYAASEIAFIGGSLVPTGGHNMLEASALGVPVISGPQVFNFTEIFRLLCEAGAASRVADAAELSERLERLFADAEAREQAGAAGLKLVRDNSGAVDRVMALLKPLLNARDPLPGSQAHDEGGPG